MSLPHVPNASQLSQLNTLQANVTSTSATLTAARTTLASAQAAYQAAAAALKSYENFIYGRSSGRSGAIDEGSQESA